MCKTKQKHKCNNRGEWLPNKLYKLGQIVSALDQKKNKIYTYICLIDTVSYNLEPCDNPGHWISIKLRCKRCKYKHNNQVFNSSQLDTNELIFDDTFMTNKPTIRVNITPIDRIGQNMGLIFDTLPLYDTYTASLSVIGKNPMANAGFEFQGNVEEYNNAISQTVTSKTNSIIFNQSRMNNRLAYGITYQISSYVTLNGINSKINVQTSRFIYGAVGASS
jgi:hypothetical protein